MIVYVDSQYKCHVAESENMIAVETSFFDGKCTSFIEGYRLIPEGCEWTREDGKIFVGEMFAPWKPYELLAAAQAQYEADQAQMADMTEALQILLEGEQSE